MSDRRRADRVAEAIREEVATFLQEGVKDPRIVALVTVTGVELTRDLRHAKVFVSVLGSDEEKASTMQGLDSVASHLKPRIGRALRLRVAPDVSFRTDKSIENASRIETLLQQLRDEGQLGADAPAADAPAADASTAGEAPASPPPDAEPKD
jgi:ribosome-binding factor A